MHGYGLAVWIRNAVEPAVKTWLDEHAAEFGFVRAFEGNLREYVYIKARDEIPARVLEIENLPPEPNFSAEEVAEASGCTWFEPPPEGWTCHGLFHEEPFKPGYLAVVDQGAGFGISPNVLTFSFKQCAGIICIDPQPFAKYNRPMLVTSNPQETVKKLAAAFDKKQSDKAAVSKISTSTADKNHSDKVAVAETSTPTVDKKQFDKAAVNAPTSNADKQQSDKATVAEIPKPLFDIKEFLPNGITPNLNGIIHPNRLRKIHCGGELYVDAARSWLAMVQAAIADGIFLNLNNSVDAYRTIAAQIKRFKRRFEEIDSTEIDPDVSRIQVEFNGKIWQLKDGEKYTDVPGQSWHGYGLAVWIRNAVESAVETWLDEHAAEFGFVRAFDGNVREYVYIKARDEIPARVLEIENLPPEPEFSAEEVAEASGCTWFEPPPEGWTCHGLFYEEPFKPGYLAVVDQGAGFGIKKKLLKSTFRQCAGIICTDTEPFAEYNCPMLLTLNPQETVEKLEKFFASSQTVDTVDDSLQVELEFFKRIHPETVIFQKKQAMARRLLKIKVEDLQFASEKPWYGEYLALLPIHIEDPALRSMAKQCVKELLRRYNDHIDTDERELAVLAILQFIKPQELTLPFNKHLLSQEFCLDIRGVFSNFYTRISYSDYDLAAYYLSMQSKWRHKKRKMRVVFIWNSNATAHDKMLTIYEALRNRDDTETFLVLTGNKEGLNSDAVFDYFFKKYPGVTIYQDFALAGLETLRPDYVFISNPYDYHLPISGCHYHDIVQFAKICHITYGANLTHNFLNRLLEEHPDFYNYVYFCFCSAETVRAEFLARFRENIQLRYSKFEFLGYPILERYYKMPATKSSATRILWTPRWSYSGITGGSHFFEYKDKFPALRKRYENKIHLSIRPHKLAFRSFVQKGLMTEEDLAEYQERLQNNFVNIYDTSVTEIDDNIKETDIFLADYSSMLIVLFLTERPIIYCEFPNADPLPEYEDMFNAMYVARSWEDVERYLDDLMNGTDPLSAKRQAVAKRIYETHKNSTQKIVNRVLQDWKDCQIDDDQ